MTFNLDDIKHLPRLTPENYPYKSCEQARVVYNGGNICDPAHVFGVVTFTEPSVVECLVFSSIVNDDGTYDGGTHARLDLLEKYVSL